MPQALALALRALVSVHGQGNRATRAMVVQSEFQQAHTPFL